jgi:hypothetical protein
MFITANGSKILEDVSFPHEDWQTMHEGLHVVLQQWLYAVIQTLWYNATGVRGLLFAVIFKFQLFGFVIYLLSDKRGTISSLFAAGLCYFAVVTLACTSRPALVTAILLATTALVMKKYGRTHNKVLLLLAPTLSLLQSNIHSTFWMALVAIVVVYAVFEMFPGLGTKNVRFNKKSLVSYYLRYLRRLSLGSLILTGMKQYSNLFTL